MKKKYEDPEILIRNYALLPRDVVTTSDNTDEDLYGSGEEGGYTGNDSGAAAANYFDPE